MQECSATISSSEKQLELAKQQLASLPADKEKALRDCEAQQRKAFEQSKQRKIKAINALVTRKLQQVQELLNTFPDLDTKDFAGRVEVKSLEHALKTLYPDKLIDDYVCLSPIEFENDSEVFQVYNLLETKAANLKEGSFAAIVFNGLTAILDKGADVPKLGLKVVLIVAGVFSVTLILSPFLFLTIFSVVGIASSIQGWRMQRMLRYLYSIKRYLNTSYDEDVFRRNSQDIMDSAREFLDEVKSSAISKIESVEFNLDSSKLTAISEKYTVSEMQLKQSIAELTAKIGSLKERLQEMIKQYDELEEEEKRLAAVAREKYLGTITWERKWLDKLLVDIVGGTKVKMIPESQDNTIFYGESIEDLQEFSRLAVLQPLLHMHPEYCTNVILDYRYNGGKLVQFTKFPVRCCKLCYTADEIRMQLENITNDISTRNDKILSTCDSIESFNTLMAEYGSTGEYYVLLHIFGLDAITENIKNMIRNGPRVGYFTKLYLTYDELEELEDLSTADFTDFYEVGKAVSPRTEVGFRRSLGL